MRVLHRKEKRAMLMHRALVNLNEAICLFFLRRCKAKRFFGVSGWIWIFHDRSN